ncbi:HEAT repeat domain-containing protein [Lentzea sp. NPDC058436]|uniref:HEAT repeat domain-containing protein n=1 Tax=Lentzea sp. NPDC058436 TaxID=3346499 RepID=UPI00365598A9
MTKKRFDEALWLMRRRDPQKAEDGFGLLRALAAEHVADLVEAFRAESDRGLRAWLLELIGEARSPEALPVLVEHLDHDDESLVSWAVRGLELLDTKEARTALYRHRTNNAHN